jgi:hypothetical protein
VGSPAACQHGPFRGFRSFCGFRGPSAHRVSPVNKLMPFYIILRQAGDRQSCNRHPRTAGTVGYVGQSIWVIPLPFWHHPHSISRDSGIQ